MNYKVRNKKIFEERQKGRTYKEIGILFGITQVRARQLILDILNKQMFHRYLKENWNGLYLEVRNANALRKAGYNSLSDALKAGIREVSKAKNIGDKTILKIFGKIIK